MDTEKFKKRVADIPDDMPVVIEFKGKLYNIMTAGVFKNQTRHGADEYFSVIATGEIKKEDLRDEVV